MIHENGELSTSTRNDSPSSAPSTLLNFTFVISRPMFEFPETEEVVGVGSCQQRFHYGPSGSIDNNIKVKKQAVKNQCLHHITQKPKYQYYVHQQASGLKPKQVQEYSRQHRPGQLSPCLLLVVRCTLHRYIGADTTGCTIHLQCNIQGPQQEL